MEYREFPQFIPFKDLSNRYLEFGGARRGYFQRGVRTISEEEFANILALGLSQIIDQSSRQNGRVREPRKTYDETRGAAISRMALMAVQTASTANGQIVPVRKKEKHLQLSHDQLQIYIEELLDRQGNVCAITGLKLQFGDPENDPALLCSLDRIDSNKHYQVDNLQVVCRFINQWKSAGNDQEFRRLIAMLRSN
jgi:hypothetical protein